MPLENNQLLQDRYLIRLQLGQGGMGAVYDAWDQRLGVRRAIKENLLLTEANQRQFEREAQLLARLIHPNLPRVTDHFVIAGQGQYLVMDFVEGMDLMRRLEAEGPLPEAEVQRWTMDILSALEYLHAQQIIHRDIKPANIKIRPDGSAVLVDFGIAKEMHEASDMTSSGARGMTPGYAPPEQYGLGHTDPRSDVYALAATLYHLLTGEVPAPAINRLADPGVYVPILQRRPDLAPGFAALIDQALAIDPNARFEEAGAMLRAMRGELPTQLPSAPKPPPELPPARPWWLWAVGAVGLLAVAATAWTLLSPNLTPPPTPNTPVALASPTAPPSLPTPTPAASATPAPPTPTLTPTTSPTSTETSLPTATPPGGGRGIAFASQREGDSEIYLMNVDGSGLRALTVNTVYDGEPAWSPDGMRLAFVSRRDGNSEIYVMDWNGANQRRLTSHPEIDQSPAWSPDGARLAFASNRDGDFDIFVMNADGANPVNLTARTGNDLEPVWSPDSARLAFVSNRISKGDVFVMNADGSDQRQLTQGGTGGAPAWSPDGTRLLFVSIRGAKREIYVMNTDGSRAVGLTSYPARASHPAWSVDGTRILFVSDEAASANEPEDLTRNRLYVMNADGSAKARLSPEDAINDNAPAWAP